MVDTSSVTGVPESDQVDVLYFAQRPSTEYDAVKLQADYTARAAINFYRFRQLGGGRENKSSDGESSEKSMKLGRSTGRGIHYVSDHPQVRMFNLSVILLLVLFESAANAYFFAQQSEFGISGGMFQAAAVSLANVSISYFIIGFWGLRHVSMPVGDKKLFKPDRRNWIRGFGVVAIVLGVILVLLVDLSAAHYRSILDLRAEGLKSPEGLTSTWPRFFISADTCATILNSDIGESIGSAATSAMCRPFALHSLDAMVLFALGLAISALAAFEGRRSDSAFPGLSDAARHFERARKDLLDTLLDFDDTYEDVLKDAQTARGDKLLVAREKVAIRRAMDERVEPFRRFLTTDPTILRDEFDVPPEVVEKILGTNGVIRVADEETSRS